MDDLDLPAMQEEIARLRARVARLERRMNALEPETLPAAAAEVGSSRATDETTIETPLFDALADAFEHFCGPGKGV